MNFTDRATWYSRFPRVAGAVAVASAMCLFTGSGAHAMDLSKPVTLPASIDDGILEVGGQRLHLPPGRWVLTAREVETTEARFRKIQTQGEGISAWAVLVAGGRLQAALWLALPTQHFQNVHRQHGNECTDDDRIQRLDFSRILTQPECLGVYGHRDLLSFFVTRSPQTLQWIREQTTSDPGPVVQFLYKIRTDGTYGAISVIYPTGPFASDAEAARWATGLRESTKGFFEGRTSDGELPPLPTSEPPSEEGAASGADSRQ